MTATLHIVGPEPGPGSWDEILAVAVRPEFSVAVYMADPDDKILGRPLCTVAGCEVMQRASATLCRFHDRRWHEGGEPPLEEFRSVEAARSRPGRIGKCLVPGCRRSRVSHELCTAHLSRWRDHGRPDLVGWAQTQPAAAVQPGTCRLGECDFPPVTVRQGSATSTPGGSPNQETATLERSSG